jgi:hypothetical protein
MNQAIPDMSDNTMYGISDEQRAESHKRLVACSISGILKDDPNDADLAIATVVALSIRDVSHPHIRPLTNGANARSDSPGARTGSHPSRSVRRSCLKLEASGHLSTPVLLPIGDSSLNS